ncbi:hypothetical protein [Streptomyces sp. V2I9]|uniref:hypothetical protein n=1 Tax=Streptomyces sp. V2I9 TaxID=3042304 RepID=UPI0027D8A444|nr:hypothetical protein [Streptomyces sp. V2I9]
MPETPDALGVPETPDAPEAVEAERVLLSLRHSHRELYLGAAEARALVGQAVEWLRRGMSGSDLRRVLTSDLPAGGVRSAVGFLRHRLVQKMPEPLARVSVGHEPGALERGVEPAPRRERGPAPRRERGPASLRELASAPESSSVVAVPRYVAPLVTCEGPGTEHVFRSLAGETQCPDCQQEAAWARWAEYRIAGLGGDARPGPEEVQPSGWRGRLAAAVAAAADRQAEPEAGRPG